MTQPSLSFVEHIPTLEITGEQPGAADHLVVLAHTDPDSKILRIAFAQQSECEHEPQIEDRPLSGYSAVKRTDGIVDVTGIGPMARGLQIGIKAVHALMLRTMGGNPPAFFYTENSAITDLEQTGPPVVAAAIGRLGSRTVTIKMGRTSYSVDPVVMALAAARAAARAAVANPEVRRAGFNSDEPVASISIGD